jgi:hypothetical protein
MRPIGTRTFTLACVLAAAAALLALGAPAARAHTVARGLVDTRVGGSAAEQESALDEDATKLNATWVRVNCSWPSAEPSQGAYDDAGYLATIKHAVEYARSLGLNVEVMVIYVPRWASDRTFWDNPPATFAAGYQVFYPIDSANLGDFRRFNEHLATLLKGQVQAYECWNEPNLWPYLYPQETRMDADFAAHTYAKYVKHFSQGIRAGDPDALVVAGSTAPGGSDDKFRSGPLQFARAFKASDTASYFDVYSHHPYTMGGNPNMDPAAPPVSPKDTVCLSNIGPLLDVFPKKPYYITEYAYSTEYSYAFAYGVSEIKQAQYLKKAYAMAAKHPQIKVLMWYLVRDFSPNGNPSNPAGCYTGLRRVGGGAKRSWYAFARGNRLTLIVPTRARRGQTIRLHGQLTCSTVGGIKGADLLVQRRAGTRPWRTMRTIQTADEGFYKTWVTFKGTCRYRLVWQGVVNSLGHLVRRR